MAKNTTTAVAPKSYIEDGIKTSPAQTAVIEKYGFEVTKRDDGTHNVTDPVLKRAGGGGVSFDKDLEKALRKAVTSRKAHDTKGSAVMPEKPAAGKKDAPTEIKGATLDKTGKREKPAKKSKEPRPPRENRYERTAKLIIANAKITEAELAKAAGCSVPAARYCLEAWDGVTAALRASGGKVPAAREGAKTTGTAKAAASGK